MRKLTREILMVCVSKAYKTAEAQGFYKEKSISHHLMMIITEIGEVLQADRKNKHGSLVSFDRHAEYEDCSEAYEKTLEDTMESELADVAIRIMSLIGFINQSTDVSFFTDENITSLADVVEVLEMKNHNTLPISMFHLVQEITYSALDVSPWWLLAGKLQNALVSVYAIAKYHKIDLVEHVLLKIQYNESRSELHDCKY